MPTKLHDLARLVLGPHFQTFEDIRPLEQMLGPVAFHKALNITISGPLGQVARKVQEKKQREQTEKAWAKSRLRPPGFGG